MQRSDIYIAAITFSTMYLVWKMLDVLILGTGLTLLGSASVLGYIAIFVTVIAAYCVASILHTVLAYTRAVLTGSHPNGDAVAAQLPKLLIVFGASVGLSLVQALWYMHNSTF